MRPARSIAAVLLTAAVAVAGCTTRATIHPSAAPAPRPIAGPSTTAAGASTTPATGQPTTGGATTPVASPRPPAWPTSPRHGAATGPATDLIAVRISRQATFDRLVLQFRDRLPGYDVRYVDPEQYSAWMDGSAFLALSLHPARAFDPVTRTLTSTGPSTTTPHYPSLQQLQLTRAYGDVLSYAIGLDHRVGFRVLTLHNPPRLVLDVVDLGVRTPVPAWSTAAHHAASAGGGVLTAIRVAHHASFDRVVFQFSGTKPGGYNVRYVPRVTQDPSDRPVVLQGRAFLQVTFLSASTMDPNYRPVYTGPTTLTPALPTLKQVRIAGDFERVLTFGLGVDHRTAFRVLTLTDPSRVVIDVAH